jgi:hypothetical protein
MSPTEIQQIAIGALQGFGASTVFVLALFIGFCVLVGFTKTKKTAGGPAMVIKSIDERMSRRPFEYLAPTAPRGPADQLNSPELKEKAGK